MNAPFDAFVVRKIGAPGQPELALGAVASGNIRTLNTAAIDAMNVDVQIIEEIAAAERAELERQEALFRCGRPAADLRAKIVVLADDGSATGASMLAAIAAARLHEPRLIVAALPVAPQETVDLLEHHADAVICLRTPRPFVSVGKWYADFRQVSDADVGKLLA